MVNRTQEFSNYAEIDTFFKGFNSSGFVNWFNTNISKMSIWDGITINQSNWQKVWNNINILFGKPKVNLIEFLSINSIIVNETGGKFLPVTETVGANGYPGISYAYDSIVNKKQSYNTLSTNWSAFKSFNDSVYKSVHSHKPFGSALKDTTDNRWNSSTFPLGFSNNIPNETDTKGVQNTFITEADFFKFRGRGLIQTTGRANYKPIIKYILNYSGDNTTIINIKNSWSSYTGNLDSIASASSNTDWDSLFQNSDSIIANYACYVHSTSPGRYVNYNIINPSQSDSNLQTSIRNVALAIAGANAKAYADKYTQRVWQQITTLDNATPNSVNPSQTATPEQPQDAGRLDTTGQDPNSQVGQEKSGAISTLTNVFKPTITPSPISFNADGR